VRFRAASEILARASAALAQTRRIGLVTAALGDHPELEKILLGLKELDAQVSVSSLRADSLNEVHARLLAGCGVRSATIAPEAGTESLRRIIGKPVSDERLMDAARVLGGAGIETLKLYFMIGLPGERDDDVEAIPVFVRQLARAFTEENPAARLSASFSAFVPKPRTPFQWARMESEEEIRRKLKILRRNLSSGTPRIESTSVGAREAVREGVLARGGRELSRALIKTSIEGLPWKAALKRSGIDYESAVRREYGAHEVFPWDLVEVGPARHTLLRSYEASLRLIRER
jgi:radical SAM superfamily enzyme YgiQ (UPF0313 family)